MNFFRHTIKFFELLQRIEPKFIRTIILYGYGFSFSAVKSYRSKVV